MPRITSSLSAFAADRQSNVGEQRARRGVGLYGVGARGQFRRDGCGHSRAKEARGSGCVVEQWPVRLAAAQLALRKGQCSGDGTSPVCVAHANRTEMCLTSTV